MLIELMSVIIASVPLILGVVLYSRTIDERMELEERTRAAVHSVFFDGKCKEGAECSGSTIKVEGTYEIKIRKPSRPFNKEDTEEKKDEALDGLYGQLEEAIKDHPEQ